MEPSVVEEMLRADDEMSEDAVWVGVLDVRPDSRLLVYLKTTDKKRLLRVSCSGLIPKPGDELWLEPYHAVKKTSSLLPVFASYMACPVNIHSTGDLGGVEPF